MSKQRFYHISFDSSLAGIWKPRTPAGMENNSNAKAAKDDTISEPNIPRICMSPDIEGCWRGVYPNVVSLAHSPRAKKGMLFHVYVAEIDLNDPNFVNNKTIVEKRLVWDAHHSREVWYTGELKMMNYELIRIFPDVDEVNYIHPFNDYSVPKREASIGMHYEVVRRFGGFYK